MSENYSYITSHPAYQENQLLRKDTQCAKVLEIIKAGANNLLHISEITGIPQAIISARVNDLIEEGRVRYEGLTVYNNRLRKKIVVVYTAIQKELF